MSLEMEDGLWLKRQNVSDEFTGLSRKLILQGVTAKEYERMIKARDVLITLDMRRFWYILPLLAWLQRSAWVWLAMKASLWARAIRKLPDLPIAMCGVDYAHGDGVLVSFVEKKYRLVCPVCYHRLATTGAHA